MFSDARNGMLIRDLPFSIRSYHILSVFRHRCMNAIVSPLTNRDCGFFAAFECGNKIRCFIQRTSEVVEMGFIKEENNKIFLHVPSYPSCSEAR